MAAKVASSRRYPCRERGDSRSVSTEGVRKPRRPCAPLTSASRRGMSSAAHQIAALPAPVGLADALGPSSSMQGTPNPNSLVQPLGHAPVRLADGLGHSLLVRNVPQPCKEQRMARGKNTDTPQRAQP